MERAADRVTNICQRIVYMITGQIVNLEDEDDASPLDIGQIEPVQSGGAINSRRVLEDG